MRKLIHLLGLLSILYSCTSHPKMTKQELELINNGDENTPYRVLLTTNKQDFLILRQKSKDVEAGEIKSKDLQLFIKRLKLTMDVESGVGIAAPQVGLERNLFLFTRLDKPGMPVEVAINPQIMAVPDSVFCFEGDGCLSVPEASGATFRYPKILVQYYNEKGEKIEEWLTGESRQGNFTGVIFQHEFDHLQGVLFTDKLCGE